MRRRQTEDAAYRVNAAGAAAVASAVARTGGRLIHVSTDYVFDGESRVPTRSTIRPSRSRYMARSEARRRAGRCELLTGVRRADGLALRAIRRQFRQDDLARLEREQATVTVVDDQFGAPDLDDTAAAR